MEIALREGIKPLAIPPGISEKAYGDRRRRAAKVVIAAQGPNFRLGQRGLVPPKDSLKGSESRRDGWRQGQSLQSRSKDLHVFLRVLCLGQDQPKRNIA
jgi:hypothetical protein